MSPLQALNLAYKLLPAKMNTVAATVPLLAIQLQEDPLRLQKQTGGPARGIWQFELGGGTKEVFLNRATRQYAEMLARHVGIEPTYQAAYKELETQNDLLDAGLARLLMWRDPLPLPAVGDIEGAWQLYLRAWAPGAYTRGNAAKRSALRHKFGVNYLTALDRYERGVA